MKYKKTLMFMLLLALLLLILGCAREQDLAGQATKAQLNRLATSNIDLSDYVTKQDLRNYIVTMVELENPNIETQPVPSGEQPSEFTCKYVSSQRGDRNGNEICENSGQGFCSLAIMEESYELFNGDNCAERNLIFQVKEDKVRSCSYNRAVYQAGCTETPGGNNFKMDVISYGEASALCCSYE